MDRQPPQDLVDLITMTREEIGALEQRLRARFPGSEVLGCVVVRNRLAIYCSESEPTPSDLRALLMAAKSTAQYLGHEILIDVADLVPPSIGDA